jgi:hypothetical protein
MVLWMRWLSPATVSFEWLSNIQTLNRRVHGLTLLFINFFHAIGYSFAVPSAAMRTLVERRAMLETS